MGAKSDLVGLRGRKDHVVDLEQPDNVLPPAHLARYRDRQAGLLKLTVRFRSSMLYTLHGGLQSVREQGGTLASS